VPIPTYCQMLLAPFAESSPNAGSPRTARGRHARTITRNLGQFKAEIELLRSRLWLPGPFGLVDCLATEVFQEVGIDLVRAPAGGLEPGE